MTPEQRAAAWQAIHDSLTGREHGSDRITATNIMRATSCTRAEAYAAITAAIRAGHLLADRVPRGRGQGTYQQLRLNPARNPMNDSTTPPSTGITITGQALILRPGDTLILVSRAPVTDYELDQIKTQVKARLDLDVAIINSVDQIAAYRPGPEGLHVHLPPAAQPPAEGAAWKHWCGRINEGTWNPRATCGCLVVVEHADEVEALYILTPLPPEKP
ncbi:hypothetical protein Aph01nite_13270 [Acrocarpospora phusangensis]|uniref:Uncharacterized protein n=1 Tax=Acrocarpospora phusangensis TaxID=1070424 RepID=A0A919Q648_9ACTN|nr:hypothetical protein [Acrocarpospora phusangensis]GIH23017.1 hypothetical protein Aph01nite_13270 [Acrocarpospora phusangensis]